VILRHDQDLVVDDENGAFTWKENDTDTRDEANTIIYSDEEAIAEDISIHEVPLSGALHYRGRMREVPLVLGMSPQVRPGHAVISDGIVDIRDDGQGLLTGAALDPTGVNRVFYEDTSIVGEFIAVSGQSVYVGIPVLPNIKLPPVHGAVAPYFDILTEYQDPLDSEFYTIQLQDNAGTGVLTAVAHATGPSGSAFVSGTINYALGTLDITLNQPTTKTLTASFTVMGGTFEFLLLAAFAGSPGISYRKALGGQFDATFLGTNANQPFTQRWDQALGGHFDVALSPTPGVGDLVQVDFRFLFEQDVDLEPLLSVAEDDVMRLTGQLKSKVIKRGSLIIRATDETGQALTARDDGGGNFVSLDVKSTVDVKNFIDYVTGAFDLCFVKNLLVGSQVTAEYTAFLEPDEVVPILDDQIATLATVDLTHIEPVDIN
jgi:hypothetical protein